MDANFVVVASTSQQTDALYSGPDLRAALLGLSAFLRFVPEAVATLYAYDMTTYRDLGPILRVERGRWSVPTPATLREAIAVQQPRTAA